MKPDTEEFENFFIELRKLCADQGFVMALNDEEDAVPGIVIGTMGYVESILTSSESFEEYAIYAPAQEGKGTIQ